MTDIVTNLQTLLAAVEAQPEQNFNLRRYRDDTECGTNFCTVGLACTMPVFQAQGYWLMSEPIGYPSRIKYAAMVGGDAVTGSTVTDKAFGTRSYGSLFDIAGWGSLDEELGYVYDFDSDTANMTDKELAIARLRKQTEMAQRGEL